MFLSIVGINWCINCVFCILDKGNSSNSKKNATNENADSSASWISEIELCERIGCVELAKHIKNTEVVINLTDSLIIQMYDFLKSYNMIMKQSISKKWFIPKTLVFSYQGTFSESLLIRNPKADYSKVEKIFGVSKAMLEAEITQCIFE